MGIGSSSIVLIDMGLNQFVKKHSLQTTSSKLLKCLKNKHKFEQITTVHIMTRIGHFNQASYL